MNIAPFETSALVVPDNNTPDTSKFVNAALIISLITAAFANYKTLPTPTPTIVEDDTIHLAHTTITEVIPPVEQFEDDSMSTLSNNNEDELSAAHQIISDQQREICRLESVVEMLESTVGELLQENKAQETVKPKIKITLKPSVTSKPLTLEARIINILKEMPRLTKREILQKLKSDVSDIDGHSLNSKLYKMASEKLLSHQSVRGQTAPVWMVV